MTKGTRGCERGDAGCYEEDGLPQRGAGPGRSPGSDMGGDDGDHGPQTTSPIYKVSEGGSIPSDMVHGEAGPAGPARRSRAPMKISSAKKSTQSGIHGNVFVVAVCYVA